MKKLRIALVAPQPFVEARGTPMANLRMAQVLADAGSTVDVISFPFGSDPEYPGVYVRRCARVPFTRSVGIGFSTAKLLTDVSLLLTALHAVRRHRYDVIHAVEEGGIMGLLLSRLSGAPLVYDMDSVMSHEIRYSVLGKFPPVIWCVSAAERRLIRRAALVVTISDSMAAYVKRLDASKDVVVVPDVPVPPPPGGADPGRARAEMSGLAVSRKLIVYTGSLASYQGLDLLITGLAEVVASVPEVLLVIVGGDGTGIRRLSALAESAGVVHNLLFVGKKPPDAVPDFLSAADVLVSPRRGGINPPAKIYSYMASGKPIVATDVPAHKTVLGPEAAILTPPTSQGIAEGLLWALWHPEESARRAARAKEIVSEITPDLQARRILEGYERLMSRVISER